MGRNFYKMTYGDASSTTFRHTVDTSNPHAHGS